MTAGAMGPGDWLFPVFGVLAAAAATSALCVVVLKPLLIRYALARPSARGLHTIPTPQGGGIAVLAGCLVGSVLSLRLFVVASDGGRLATILVAAAGLALLGLFDDIRPLPALPRLLLQLVLMGVGVAALPEGSRPLPFLPFGLERALLVVGGTWFINLTNFMDGMDWITVADMVPVTAALIVFWQVGRLPDTEGVLALGLLGGLLGYAPFNKPPARLFLGDVGSLPIGFLVALCLFALAARTGTAAGSGALAAAILLPLYPVADSGITLLWRLRRGEKIWQPHRNHFYQVAIVRGHGVWAVLARILTANILLAGLGFGAARGEGWTWTLGCGVAGVLVTAIVLRGLGARKATTSKG